jgi:hypothetical protein
MLELGVSLQWEKARPETEAGPETGEGWGYSFCHMQLIKPYVLQPLPAWPCLLCFDLTVFLPHSLPWDAAPPVACLADLPLFLRHLLAGGL